MNKKLRELLMKERYGMLPQMFGLGDEPDEEMGQDALKFKHKPVDMSKCQIDEHAPSKVASKFPCSFLPAHLVGIAAHENEG